MVSRYFVHSCSLKLLSKTTYIVLKLGKHGENRNMEERIVSTRHGNIVSFSRVRK